MLLQLHAHLNAVFVHYVEFNLRFNIVDDKELEVRLSMLFVTQTKGSLTLESFLLLSQISKQKKMPKPDPEHYPSKEKMLKVVIWHLFLEI